MKFRETQAGTTAIFAIIVALLMAVALDVPAYADQLSQQSEGIGPATALAPTGERETLGPNEKRWYTFLYAEGADGDDEPSDALAELTMAVPDSVSFEVWTEDDVNRWRNGEDFSPTGAGTAAFDQDAENNRDRSRLTWVGSGQATTTWYIIVENETARAAPFTLTVSGPDVLFPEAVSETTQPDTGDAGADAEAAADSGAMTDSQTMDVVDGIGPASALTPTGTRRTLAPGETRWYTFQYVEGVDGDEDAEPSEAVVEAAISRPNSIGFEVWTEDDVNRWANGEDFTPTGAGTPAFAIEDEDSDGRDRRLLRWVGSGEATTTWYIILENNSDAPASYRLTATGPDVIFPDRDMEATGTAASTQPATDADQTATASDSTTAEGGTGPNDALTPTGTRQTLGADEMRWYAFSYTGGADDEDPEEIVAELRMAIPGSISFEVWNEDDVRMWQNEEEFVPTGAGTPAFTIEDDPDADNRNRSLLRWVGSGQATTDWYIVVENETDAPASYRLSVRGPDLSF